MGRWTILDRKADPGGWPIRFGGKARPIRDRDRSRFRQSGVSLIELSVTLALLLGIALFGLKTMVSAWMLDNWAIGQSMTDAYAGIETAYAQRWVFDNIPVSGRWPVYPNSAPTQVTMGQTPSHPVTATVTRTCHPYQDPVTGALAYLLESYVVYQDGQRNYCKVSKVYRDE